jgi:hypothetical protein
MGRQLDPGDRVGCPKANAVEVEIEVHRSPLAGDAGVRCLI